jgi:uncharacterized protein (TIGR02646 family)
MRNDNAGGGTQAAHDCRAQAVSDQYGLCAFCEQRISIDDPLHCHVEHFHPKSDRSKNWGLNWQNMLAVCDGGSAASQKARQCWPLPDNLSCDAHKDRMIQTGTLPTDCDGWLLNPLDLPAFPNLFALDKGKGHLETENAACRTVVINGNRHSSTAELITNTIRVLNLNCERLAEKRRQLVVNVDQNKKMLRQKGIRPADMPEKLVSRYFNEKWPQFFTALRCCLGEAVEKYLQNMHFQG